MGSRLQRIGYTNMIQVDSNLVINVSLLAGIEFTQGRIWFHLNRGGSWDIKADSYDWSQLLHILQQIK